MKNEKMKVKKKTIIIAIAIAIYIIGLPLAFYISFKNPEQSDVQQLQLYEPQWVSKTDEEKLELLDSIDFDLELFEENGFKFELASIWVYAYGNEPDKIAYLSLRTEDYANFISIRLIIYLPQVQLNSSHFWGRDYERREINGKAVGFFEYNESGMRYNEARYYNEQNGCAYYIEPFMAFSDTDIEFVKLIVS